MNNISSRVKNYLAILNKYIKDNYKIISVFFIVIFISFLGYQYYSYINIKNIHKNSIIYFNAKDFEPNNDFYKLMETLSSNKDFYSVISILEMININIKNENLALAEELYLTLLDNKDLSPIYVSAIASHASYNFLNILFKNSDLKLKSKINNFINYINESLDTYIGIKLEIKYLLAIAEQDINNISPDNDLKTTELHKLIMESNDISSSIKERVNKIHEFQIYK